MSLMRSFVSWGVSVSWCWLVWLFWVTCKVILSWSCWSFERSWANLTYFFPSILDLVSVERCRSSGSVGSGVLLLLCTVVLPTMIAAVCSVTAWLMADTVAWGSGGWGASASDVEWVPGAVSCLVAAMTSRTTCGTAAAISSVTIPVTLACRASSVSEGRGSSSPLATWPELKSDEDAPLPCGRGWDRSSRSNDWPELSPGHLFFVGSGACEQSLSSESSANLWGFRRILTPLV